MFIVSIKLRIYIYAHCLHLHYSIHLFRSQIELIVYFSAAEYECSTQRSKDGQLNARGDCIHNIECVVWFEREWWSLWIRVVALSYAAATVSVRSRKDRKLETEHWITA